jgi:hypothetical protein
LVRDGMIRDGRDGRDGREEGRCARCARVAGCGWVRVQASPSEGWGTRVVGGKVEGKSEACEGVVVVEFASLVRTRERSIQFIQRGSKRLMFDVREEFE